MARSPRYRSLHASCGARKRANCSRVRDTITMIGSEAYRHPPPLRGVATMPRPTRPVSLSPLLPQRAYGPRGCAARPVARSRCHRTLHASCGARKHAKCSRAGNLNGPPCSNGVTILAAARLADRPAGLPAPTWLLTSPGNPPRHEDPAPSCRLLEDPLRPAAVPPPPLCGIPSASSGDLGRSLRSLK